MNATTIDFLHPRRTPWLGWCVLTVGSAMLIAALWLDSRWTAERAHRELAARKSLEAIEFKQRTAMQTPTPSADRLRFERIAPQLHQPWLPTLRVIENATAPPVLLLSLSIDPATGVVRLEGEASEFDQAVAYAQGLDDDSFIGPAQLRSHEIVTDSASGQAVTRFSIVTRWKNR